MDSRSTLLFTFFTLVAVASISQYAAVSPEEYWQQMLPDTSIPDTIRKRLPSSTPNDVGEQMHMHHDEEHTHGPNHHSKSFEKQYANQIFFLESYLHMGRRFNLSFMRTMSSLKFLPRDQVHSLPFSSSKLSEILKKLSIDPKSHKAQKMKETLETCEKPPFEGEVKTCATSLESMIDFAISQLGDNHHLQAPSTHISKDADLNGQLLTLTSSGVERYSADKMVACHESADYAYSIYHCHAVANITAYALTVVGDKDGSINTALGVCHLDTSQWDPNDNAFKVLKVKPMTVPVCHFLMEGSIVWVPKEQDPTTTTTASSSAKSNSMITI